MKSLVFFSHDVIKIGPEILEQKGNILRIVQPTMHSTFSVYNFALDSEIIHTERCSYVCNKLLTTFAHFHVLSLRVHPRAIKVFLLPLYLSHEKSYQALHTCIISMLMFQNVEAWE